MGVLLEFPMIQQQRLSKERTSIVHTSAKVFLFEGVQYSREGETNPPQRTTKTNKQKTSKKKPVKN